MDQKSNSKESIDLPATKFEVYYPKHKRSNSEISAWQETHKKSEYKKVFNQKIDKQTRNEGLECIKQRNFKLPCISKSIRSDDAGNKGPECNEDLIKDMDQVKNKNYALGEKSFKVGLNANCINSCGCRNRASSIMQRGNKKGWFYDWKGESCGSVVRINEFHGYSIKVVRKIDLGDLNRRFFSNVRRSKLDIF